MAIQVTQKLSLVAALAADPPPSLPLPLVLDLLLLPSPHTAALVGALLSTDASLLPALDDTVTRLIARLASARADDVYAATALLRAIADAHDDLAAAVLEHAELVPALRDAYARLAEPAASAGPSAAPPRLAVVRAKASALLLARRLRTLMSFAAGSDALTRLMGGGKGGAGGADGPVLRGRSLGGDMELFDGVYVDEATLGVLREIDVVECTDPRLDNLSALFPRIPAYLLVAALRHPRYTPPPSSNPLPPPSAAALHPQSTAAATQALIDALLGGGGALPPELADLGAAAAASAEAGAEARRRERSADDGGWGASAGADAGAASTSARPARIERSNIWDEQPLDLSRLRLKDDAPAVGADIPSTLRDSILRLVEAQAEEAEAERRALAEARGVVRRPRGLGDMAADGGDGDTDGETEALGKAVRVGARDESESDGEQDGDAGSGSSRAPSPTPEQARQRAAQTTLELAYIRDPSVFERDAATKRGAARARLREQTGMDDGQIEGWRVMLERNPHKDAILGQHQWAAPANRAAPTPAEGQAQGQRGRGQAHAGRGGGRGGSSSGGGGRGGGSTSGQGSGRGSAAGSARAIGANTPRDNGSEASARTGGTDATGGTGGTGARGRGRGGGKGSRGHQNAARVRGHDRKMARGGMSWD